MVVLATAAVLLAAAILLSSAETCAAAQVSNRAVRVLSEPVWERHGDTHHSEWEMEASCLIASICSRAMYCKLEPDRPCDLPQAVNHTALQEWASKDPGWERVFKSLSLYELARRFWQQHDYDRTILAIEQALAHKLFPYTDAEMLERWQRRLVRPGLAFKRPKLELADALTLKANTLYELGKRDRSIEHLYQTLEAVQLSAALMHTCQQTVKHEGMPEVVRHMQLVTRNVGVVAMNILQNMRQSTLQALLGSYGLKCPTCTSKAEYLQLAITHYALPLAVDKEGNMRVLENSFVYTAYARQPSETTSAFMQRLFAHLQGMVHRRFYDELGVPCAVKSADGKSCLSHLPDWVLADEIDERDVPIDTDGMERDETVAGDEAQPRLRPSLAAAAARAAACAFRPKQCRASAAVPPVPALAGFPAATEAVLADHLDGADRVRNMALNSINSLLDGWLREGLTADMQQLVNTLELFSGVKQIDFQLKGNQVQSVSVDFKVPNTVSEDEPFYDTALGEDPNDFMLITPAPPPQAPDSGEKSRQIMKSFQVCLANASLDPAVCLFNLERFATYGVIGDVQSTAQLPMATRFAPWPPLPFKPPPPPRDQCCPKFRRKLTDPPDPQEAAQSSAKHSRVPLHSGAVAEQLHIHVDSATQPSSATHTIRQAVDKQLKEQLDRQHQNGHNQAHDDPIVILTLSGAALGTVLAVSLAKHKKRVVRFLLERKSCWQSQLGNGKQSGRAGMPAAEQPALAQSPATPPPGSRKKQQQAANRRGGGAASAPQSPAPSRAWKGRAGVAAAPAGAAAPAIPDALSRCSTHAPSMHGDDVASTAESAVSGVWSALWAWCTGGRRKGRGAHKRCVPPEPSAAGYPATPCQRRATWSPAPAVSGAAFQGEDCSDSVSSFSHSSSDTTETHTHTSAALARNNSSRSDSAQLSATATSSQTTSRKQPQAAKAASRRAGAGNSSGGGGSGRSASQAAYAGDHEAGDEDDGEGWKQLVKQRKPRTGGGTKHNSTAESSQTQHHEYNFTHSHSYQRSHFASPASEPTPRASPASVVTQRSSYGVVAAAPFSPTTAARERVVTPPPPPPPPARAQPPRAPPSQAAPQTPAAQHAPPSARRSLSRSGGWLDWISNGVLSTSPSTQTYVQPPPPPPPPARPSQPLQAAKAAAPRPPAPSQSAPQPAYQPALQAGLYPTHDASTNNTNSFFAASSMQATARNADASLLQHAQPIRTSAQYQQGGKSGADKHDLCGATVPGSAGSAIPAGSPPGTASRGVLMGALSSLIGYATSPPSTGAVQAAAGVGSSVGYSSVIPSTSPSSSSSPPPVAAGGHDAASGAAPAAMGSMRGQGRNSLLDLLPASLVDSLDPSPPVAPSPLTSRLNPAAPSFRMRGEEAAQAATPTAAGVPVPGGGAYPAAPPRAGGLMASAPRPAMPNNSLCTNLTGLHPSQMQAVAAAATQRLRGDPFAQPLSARTDAPLRKSQAHAQANSTAAPAHTQSWYQSTDTTATTPAAFSSYNAGGADVSALVQPFAGGFAAAASASSSVAPAVSAFASTDSSHIPLEIAAGATVSGGARLHQSLADEIHTHSLSHAASGLATSAVSLPSALQGFSMFANNSVWSPSAVGGADGRGGGGWGSAAAKPAGADGWGNAFATAPAPPGVAGGVVGGGGLFMGGARTSVDDMHRLGDDMQANDLAQNILRTLVDG